MTTVACIWNDIKASGYGFSRIFDSQGQTFRVKKKIWQRKYRVDRM